MSGSDPSPVNISSGNIRFYGNHVLSKDCDCNKFADFMPVSSYADNTDALTNQIMKCVYTASNEITKARHLMHDADTNFKLDVHSSRGCYGEGECDVTDMLVIVLAACVKRGRWVESPDGSYVWHDDGMVEFADDAIITRALGWLIDHTMGGLTKAPKWWDKFISIRNNYFHDGAKRHAMTIVAAAMWCLNARKWRDYDNSKYDFLHSTPQEN